MTSTPVDVAKLADLIDELQRRIGKLEKQLAESQERHGPVPIDTILAISAGVAAYLGKKATVRQIHYSHTNSWARMGRSNIHASHTITRSRSH